ncbi:MAG: alpha/beta fold hydrolase [Acidimicrobiales bacterium]
MTTRHGESVFFRSGALRLHAIRHRADEGGRASPPAAGGRRPIVVVPGITTPAGAFSFAGSAFARMAGVGDVIVLDMRGRGLSERAPSGQHRAGDYAEDVLALIDHLQLWAEQPLLVGHSLGARVVASARARVPGCSAGVVAIDPPMSGPGRRPYPMGVDRFLDGIHGAREGRGVADARAHYPTWSDEQVAQRGEWLGSCDELAVVESYSWFHLEAFEPVWQEVEPPALLLYGDESPVVTSDDAAHLHEVNPRADLVSVAHAGHMIPWDNLEQTVGEIGSFLSKLEETQ